MNLSLMMFKKAFHILILVMVFIGQLMAVPPPPHNWEGDVDSDWNDPNNWENNVFPTASEQAIIDPGNYTSAPAITANSSFTPKAILARNGGDLIISANVSTVNSNIQVDGVGSTITVTTGTISTGTGAFLASNGGVMTVNGGTITCGAMGALTASAIMDFNGGSIAVTGNATIATGGILRVGAAGITGSGGSNTFDMVTFGGGIVEIEGTNVFPTGFETVTLTLGTVDYNGSIQTIESSFSYNNLSLSGSATKTCNNNLDINGNLSIDNNVTLDPSTFDINLAGNWDNDNTTASAGFTETTSTVTFDGAAAQAIDHAGGTETFYNLTASNTGTVTPSCNIGIDNDFLFDNSGTFNMGANTMTGNGGSNSFTMSGSVGTYQSSAVTSMPTTFETVTLSAGRVQLTNAGAQNINSGISFYQLQCSGSGIKTMQGTLDVNDDLIIDNGATLSAGTFDITMGGNWDNNNTTGLTGFTPGSRTVTFDGTSGQTIDHAGGTEQFHHVVVNTTGGDLDMNDHINVDGDITIADDSELDCINNTITIAGNWDNNETTGQDGFTEGMGTVIFDGNVAQSITHGSGFGERFYNITISNTIADVDLGTIIGVDGTLTIDDGANLDAGMSAIFMLGNWDNNNTIAETGYTFNVGFGAVQFIGTGAQSIDHAGGTEKMALLTASHTGTITVNCNIDIDVFFTFNQSGTFNMGPYTMTGNGGANNFTMNGSAGTYQTSANTSMPTTFETMTMTAGKVQLTKAGAQDINSGLSFFELQCSGSGIKSMLGSLDVNSNLTIDNGATLDASTFDIDISGNWDNDNVTAGAGFTEGTGQVTFDGGAAQTLSHAGGEEQFYDVDVNKSANGLLLNDRMRISASGTLTFTQGIVSSSTGNEVIFNNGALTNGGDADSYVDGPVTKIGTDAFIFPLGDGVVWARMGISAPDNAADQFTAEYTNAAPADLSVDLTLNNSSELEFWDLNEDNDAGAATSINVTLYWENAASSGIDNYSTDLVVADYDGSDWVDAGQSAIVGASPGNLTSNAMTSFTSFSFGSKSSSLNPLPIDLLLFEAKTNADRVDLTWVTGSEINNSFFTVERSSNGNSWEKVLETEGAGNSNQILTYEEYDYNPLNGVSYYRLKQTDFDGDSSYSNVVVVEFAENGNDNFTAFPNPVSLGATLNIESSGMSFSEWTFEIRDIWGRQVSKFQQPDINDENLFRLPIEKGITPGTYYLIGISENMRHQQKIVVQ